MITHAALHDWVAMACFAAFVLGAWFSAPRFGELAGGRKRRATLFTLWVLAVTIVVGVTERDLYPFTSWALIAWIYPTSPQYSRLLAVDAHGAELEVDYRAWQPISVDELAEWMALDFLKLDSAEQTEVAQDLLRRANAAALRVRAGARPGSFDRFLGPLSAPQFHLHPAPWSSRGALPALPLQALRLYTEQWDPDERARDPTRVTRRLRYEYRSAP